MARIEFNTTAYEFSHGHTPRGRGSWAFSIFRNPVAGQIYWATPNLTYRDAQAEARQYFSEFNGVQTVYVLP